MAAGADTLDPSLLAAPKKKTEPEAAPPPAEVKRVKKVLKIAAYVAIFFFAFLFFLLLKIPSQLITNYVFQQLNFNTPYTWQAEKASLSLFPLPHLRFENLEITPKMQGAVTKVTELKVYPSIMSLVPSSSGFAPAASFKALAFGANLSGFISAGANPDIEIYAESLDLTKIDALAEAGIANMLKGVITNAEIDLSLGNQRLSRATGTVTVKGKSLSLDPAGLNLGLPLPILNAGSFELVGRADNGKLRFEKFQIGEPGKDIELKVEGQLQLSEPITYTRAELRLRFKLSEAVKKAVPNLDSMLGLMAAKRADGYYGAKLNGTLMNLGVPTPDP